MKVPAWDVPLYRQNIAKNYGVEKNFAFITYGGLGDVLCSEPTIRYACEVLKPAFNLNSITVITKYPELFSHLPVETLQTSQEGKLELEDGEKKYHFLYCGHTEENLQHLFFTHNSMLPVDYPALSALRTQLPLAYRTIKTKTSPLDFVPESDWVYVHAGAHWSSKTFPKSWWDDLLNNLAYRGLVPVLIGSLPTTSDLDPGTVDVNSSGCLDLRGKLSIEKTASHFAQAKVVITTDSFPLHLATIGHAHIGFFATAKDPEWLMHYRKTDSGKIEFGWRMEDLALGGAYQRSFKDSSTTNKLSDATQGELAGWLPSPDMVATWAEGKLCLKK
jgi:hypothetical protein